MARVRFIMGAWGAWAWGVGARGLSFHQSCKDLCHIIFIHYNIYTYPVYYFHFPFLLSIPRLGSRNPHTTYPHYISNKPPLKDTQPKDYKTITFGKQTIPKLQSPAGVLNQSDPPHK